jgi:hypothetical protein
VSRALSYLQVALAVASALCAGSPSSAWAVESATISASFSPEKLGAPTAISLSFQVRSAGSIPSPLTGIDLRFPGSLGFATSGLGVAACGPELLQARGPAACPPDSLMGTGSALTRFQIGPERFQERASIAIVAGPPQNGYVTLLICATGLSPIAARIVMPTLLLPGHLQIKVPLVPSLPEGPSVSLVQVRATLGGNMTYYERVHGKTVSYHPRGAGLPRTCPRRGFAFAATFSFLDGTRATARTAVACPRRAHA